jgi:hypothetical protein
MINHKFYHKINKNIDFQSVLNLLDNATDNYFDPNLVITDINNI